MMVDRRVPLVDLPFWPLFLGQDEAARYLGVSIDVFSAEVAAGLWPAPKRRGSKGGRLTWHRPSLDAAAARDAGIDQPGAEADGPILAPGVWKGRSRGSTKEDGIERLPQKAT